MGTIIEQKTTSSQKSGSKGKKKFARLLCYLELEADGLGCSSAGEWRPESPSTNHALNLFAVCVPGAYCLG